MLLQQIDGWTDAVPLHRPCSAYYTSSTNKLVNNSRCKYQKRLYAVLLQHQTCSSLSISPTCRADSSKPNASWLPDTSVVYRYISDGSGILIFLIYLFITHEAAKKPCTSKVNNNRCKYQKCLLGSFTLADSHDFWSSHTDVVLKVDCRGSYTHDGCRVLRECLRDGLGTKHVGTTRQTNDDLTSYAYAATSAVDIFSHKFKKKTFYKPIHWLS